MAISWVCEDEWCQSEQPVLFPVFGQAIRIMAYIGFRQVADRGVLTTAHIAAVEGLLAVPPARRADWSAAVFADFKQAVDSGDCELDAADIPERCRVPEDVWSLVQWSEVLVPDQGPRGDRFILVHGRPGWRIEHGLQLVLKNEQLLWVGRGDEALFLNSGPSRDYLPRRRR